ncbi:MAG: hypothetical protein ACYSTI_13335 [Planctomycetota bacterium]
MVLRTEAQEARTAAIKKQAELETEEAQMMAALQAGALVEPGSYLLLVTTEPRSRSVAWRKVCEQHLGKAFAEQVLASTLPAEEQVLKVVQEVKTGT